MRKTVFTKTGNKVRVHVKPYNSKYRNNYVIRARLTGELPVMWLVFGEEYADGFYSWDLERHHIFQKQLPTAHVVELNISKNNIIDYIEPCGGDCHCELVDFSDAPDIISAYIKYCDDVKLNNPTLRRLEMYIEEASEIDLSSCINLRELSIGCGDNAKELDLTNCRNLESLRVCGFSSKALTDIILDDTCPLRYADVRGCKLNEECIFSIRRIIERNNGIYEDYIEKLYKV